MTESSGRNALNTAHGENISQYDSTSDPEQKIEFIQDKMMAWIMWIASGNIILSISTRKWTY